MSTARSRVVRCRTARPLLLPASSLQSHFIGFRMLLVPKYIEWCINAGKALLQFRRPSSPGGSLHLIFSLLADMSCCLDYNWCFTGNGKIRSRSPQLLVARRSGKLGSRVTKRKNVRIVSSTFSLCETFIFLILFDPSLLPISTSVHVVPLKMYASLMQYAGRFFST